MPNFQLQIFLYHFQFLITIQVAAPLEPVSETTIVLCFDFNSSFRFASLIFLPSSTNVKFPIFIVLFVLLSNHKLKNIGLPQSVFASTFFKSFPGECVGKISKEISGAAPGNLTFGKPNSKSASPDADAVFFCGAFGFQELSSSQHSKCAEKSNFTFSSSE